MRLSSLRTKEERMDEPIRLLRCCYELTKTTHWLHVNHVIFWSIIDDLDNQTGEQTLKGLQRPESTRYYKTIFIKHT